MNALENAEKILVVAFPPSALINLTLLDIIFSLPMDVPFETKSYELSVPFGTYLVGSLMIESGKSIGIESLKGLHPNFLKVTEENPNISDINIMVDFNEE